jgi:hypothetical protein
MQTLIKIIAILALSSSTGLAVATPEKLSSDFFPKPYVSLFEQLDNEKEENIQIAAVTCFGTGERTSGMNKICYYSCLGSSAAITISSVELCPLTIKQ